MTCVQQLNVTNFRNFAQVSIAPSAGLNLVYGENGSGKTSLLEAIHVLSTGKSFRSSLVDPLIKNEEKAAIIFAVSESTKIGLSKPRNQKHQLRINEENQRNWDQAARLLPSLVIDSNAFDLLEGGPKARRRFMDWGVFHVEPGFLSNWRRVSKCLANRNRLLKQGLHGTGEIEAWEAELEGAAHAVDQSRQGYLDRLLPIFRKIYIELVGVHNELEISYKRGWAEGQSLGELLRNNRETDIRYGATQSGPHRADLDIKFGTRRAVETLSRGQEKLLVCALKIAQGQLLAESADRNCIYLVDDLPAELDRNNRMRVLSQLVGTRCQLFVTSVEADAVALSELPAGTETARFHVERGIIKG